MVRIERVFGSKVVDEEMKADPRLWRSIGGTEDSSHPEDWIFLKATTDEGTVLGYFVFHEVEDGIYQAHPNLFSKFWGKKNRHLTTLAGIKGLQFANEELGIKRVIAIAPHSVPQTQRYASRIGMTLVGRDNTAEYFEKRY